MTNSPPALSRRLLSRVLGLSEDASNQQMEAAAPRLMIRALRDPDGANLDRVQIVKGWLDGNGALQEQIYDVACSDERPIMANNRCDGLVGSTVNVDAASFTNDIGSARWMAFWQDPDFDRDDRAF